MPKELVWLGHLDTI